MLPKPQNLPEFAIVILISNRAESKDNLMHNQASSENTMIRILIVEDDQRLATLTKTFLEKNGYKVDVEHDGSQAEKRILSEQPDLVILDLMLPGQDGLSICRKIRPEYKHPVIMLTAQTDDTNQILGLEVGADDYVTKPVQPQVLLARIRAVMRRQEAKEENVDETDNITIDNISIEFGNRIASVDGEQIDLTSSEFDLLWLLMKNAGNILSREDILGTTRGIEYDGLDRSIDVRISKIRKKIGDDLGKPSRIKTIRSKGYLFVKNIK